MALPSHSEIIKGLSEINKKNKKNQDSVLRVPAQHATVEERFKFNISQKLLEFKISKGHSYEDMAKILGADRSNINRILNGRISKVSLDRMFSYLQIVVVASKNKKMLKDFNKRLEHFIEFEELKFS